MKKKISALLAALAMSVMLSVPVMAAVSPTGTPNKEVPPAPKTGYMIEYVIAGTGVLAGAAVVSGRKLKKRA